MSSKRILDAIAIFRASRGVASKHVGLRKKQLDKYNRTSTLAHAIKHQTDRVTLTFKAASALAKRFSDVSPEHSAQPTSTDRTSAPSTIPEEEKAPAHPGDARQKTSLEQDHFYERSEANSAAESAPSGNITVGQREAATSPLPDGTLPLAGTPTDARNNSPNLAEKEAADPPHPDQARRLQWQAEGQIPSRAAEPPPASSSSPDVKHDGGLSVSQEQDVYHTPPTSSGPVLSALPRVKLPKKSWTSQESDEHVPDEGINQDVYYLPASQGSSQIGSGKHNSKEEYSLPDKAYADLFQSSKVANMLRGGKERVSPPKLADFSKGQDRSSYGNKPTGGNHQAPRNAQSPLSPEAGKEDININQLATNISKDADVPAPNQANVCVSNRG